jgi:hypothetical protein
MTGSRAVVVFEQVQVVENWLPSAYRRRLQSPSAAESPKQDCGENLSAKHSDIAARGTAGAVAKAGRSEECGDLASEASKEGLVFRSGGEF